MTKKSLLSFALLAATSMAALSTNAAARPMTPTDLATLKRLGSPDLSPDGETIVYQLRETDLEANRGKTDIWTMPAEGGQATKLAAKADVNEHSPAYSPDGKYIYFLSNEGGKEALWRVAASGGEAKKISNVMADISGFKLSNSGNQVAIWGDIAKDCQSFGCKNDGNTATKGPGTGREYTENFVRHWSSWETPGNYSRIFAFDIGADGMLAANGTAIDRGITGDSPSKPFGGGEEIAWTPSDRGVIFTARKADRNEPKSTNLDLYVAGASDDKNAVNVTIGNKGTDTLPTPSPDGAYMAWAAMKRAGYESDKLSIKLRNMESGKLIDLTADWDRSVSSITWATDSKSMYVTAGEKLDYALFNVDLSGKVKRLTKEGRVSSVLPKDDGSVIVGMASLHGPTELYHLGKDGERKKITSVNDKHLGELNKITTQRFDFAGAEGDQVWGQIIKPEGAKGKLPVLFLVHGGPQGSFGDLWSFRWNPKVMASQGYAVVTIDFHGSTGYGQKFTDSINQDWGGKPLTDLKLGLAAAGEIDSQIDIKNSCALGASYGGYMMNWIAGNWNDGFKCLINHAGLFDLRSFAYSTEELWFDQWDHGGPWAKRPNAEKWNPVNHAENWKTPMLVIHGEKDFRIPYTQSLMAFTNLQEKGIDSKLVVFPDENHWILKAQNSIQWHNNVFDWAEKYLKPVKKGDGE